MLLLPSHTAFKHLRKFRDMARRGALILFEGVDRCGKTTQARKLAEALNASEPGALFMRFPGARGAGHDDQ